MFKFYIKVQSHGLFLGHPDIKNPMNLRNLNKSSKKSIHVIELEPWIQEEEVEAGTDC